MEENNPELYEIPYCHISKKISNNSLSAIDKRLRHFAELQENIWFGVMNWVLDQLRHTDPNERRRHLWGHCFYFDWKKIKHPVYDYKHLW